MRTSKLIMGVLAISVTALCGAANGSELIISLAVDAAQLDPGYTGEIQVRIYGEALGTPSAGEGIHSTNITIYGNGVAEPKEKFPPPASGKVATAWESYVSGNFSNFDATRIDADGDTDLDARNMSFADVGSYGYTTLGTTGAELIATQTWIKAAGELVLDVEVKPESRHFQWTDPEFPDSYSTTFDTVTGIGIGEGGGGGTDPNADEVIPAAMTIDDRGAWQGGLGWGDPVSWLELTAEEPPKAPIDEYEWDFGGGLVLNGQTIIITIQDLIDAGYVVPDYNDPDLETEGIIPYTLTLYQGADQSSADSGIFVPEPTTIALLGMGMGLLLRRRRRS